MARLLMLMMGDEGARSQFIASRQLPKRDRLDDTKLKSLKVEYWISIGAEYNDPTKIVDIVTKDSIVDMYLRSNMASSFRGVWTPSKLREQYRLLRADYEGSLEKRNYDQSGQNGPLFYPDFQTKNPAHVLLHYLLREMPEGGVLGDMPKAAVVDTAKPETIDVSHTGDEDEESDDVESYDDESANDDEDEQEATPATPQPVIKRRGRRRHRKMRSASPASTSSGSSLTADKTRQRNAYAVKNASETIKNACSSLVSSFQDMRKTVFQKEHTKKSDSLDRVSGTIKPITQCVSGTILAFFSC